MTFIENHKVPIWENNITDNETIEQMFDIMLVCLLLKNKKNLVSGIKSCGNEKQRY